MLIIYGFYRFAQKRIGYRNDFCLTCQTECLAEQWRAFNCGHLFWIPILPLGFFKRWLCSTCENNPHVNIVLESDWKVGVLRFLERFSIASLAGALIVTTLKWKDPEGCALEPYPFWIMTLFLGALYAPLFEFIRRKRTALGLSEHLLTVKPARLDICPYCDQRLNDEGFCRVCQLQRCDVNDLRR